MCFEEFLIVFSLCPCKDRQIIFIDLFILIPCIFPYKTGIFTVLCDRRIPDQFPVFIWCVQVKINTPSGSR